MLFIDVLVLMLTNGIASSLLCIKEKRCGIIYCVTFEFKAKCNKYLEFTQKKVAFSQKRRYDIDVRIISEVNNST